MTKRTRISKKTSRKLSQRLPKQQPEPYRPEYTLAGSNGKIDPLKLARFLEARMEARRMGKPLPRVMEDWTWEEFEEARKLLERMSDYERQGKTESALLAYQLAGFWWSEPRSRRI